MCLQFIRDCTQTSVYHMKTTDVYNHFKLWFEQRLIREVSEFERSQMGQPKGKYPYVSEEEAQKALNDQSHKAIAKQAALQSFVLLKNEKSVLPLKNVKKWSKYVPMD